MEWGERGIRKSLEAKRARARKPASPEEAARNRLEENTASRDAENALKAPDELIAAAGEAIRPEFRLGFLVDRLKDEPDMISVIASEHRVELAACVGPRVAESAIDVAQTAQAANSLEKMVCHQMAAGHRVAMKQLSMALNETLPVVEIARISNAAARMMQVPGGAAYDSPHTRRWSPDRSSATRSGFWRRQRRCGGQCERQSVERTGGGYLNETGGQRKKSRNTSWSPIPTRLAEVRERALRHQEREAMWR